MRTGDDVRLGRPLLVAVAGGLPLVHAFACTTDEPPPAVPNDAAPDILMADVGDTFIREDDADPPRPAEIPENWERYDGYSKLCQHYLPKDAAWLPPPIRWKPCDVDASVSCRQIAEEPGQKNSIGAHASRRTSGEIAIAFARTSGGLRYHLVADADGPTRFALLSASDRCQVDRHRLYGERFTIALTEQGTLGGMLIGDVHSFTPRVATRFTDVVAHDMYPASFAILSLSNGHSFRSYRWSDGAFDAELVAPDGYQNDDPRSFEGGFTWTSDNGVDTKVRLYTPTGGARDLIRSGQLAVGDGSLGTDTVDMVWLRAYGRSSVGPKFSNVEIFAAPFTTDPSAVASRRLRSEEGTSVSVREFTVGCGYAARSTGADIRIIRIATGESWKLPTLAGWSEPLVITCDEIFMRAYFGFGTVARVRLDSLGPPIPPD